jgi:DNA-binding PadR family transcriptional regulator
MRPPSELEGAVLGIIRQAGSCTAYAVRSHFLASPSPQWSGSAGAIYPLMERLERRGLIRSKAQTATRRNGRLYSLTPRGSRLLAEWLAPPLPDWVVGVPPDPLRTRVGFLGILPPAERQAFVAGALAGVEAHMRIVHSDLERRRADRSPWERLTARGALAMLKARRAWLRLAAREIGAAPAPAPSRPRKGASRQARDRRD